jgi:hypothetical protein
LKRSESMPRRRLLHWLSDDEAGLVGAELAFAVVAVGLAVWILGAALRMLRRPRR